MISVATRNVILLPIILVTIVGAVLVAADKEELLQKRVRIIFSSRFKCKNINITLFY